MSATLPPSFARVERQSLNWVPLALGLLVLFVPSYVAMARDLWGTEHGAHGPIVLGTLLWAFWTKRDALLNPTTPSKPIAGAGWVVFGLLIYLVGRSQTIVTLEAFAQIFLLIGVLLLTGGWALVRLMAIPIAFLLFLAPPPQFITDILTAPLKLMISEVVESVLYFAGYPIARNGVLLTIGKYELLVADACSGLNSLFSLGSMGLLYLYLVQHKSKWRAVLMLTSIIPIAILANIIRVIVLTLVTYHYGDAAGQGFIHNASGLVVFVVALATMIGFDLLLGRFFFRNPTSLKATAV